MNEAPIMNAESARVPYNLKSLEQDLDFQEDMGSNMPVERSNLNVAKVELKRLSQDEVYRREHIGQYLLIQDGVGEWHAELPADIDRMEILVLRYTRSLYTGRLDLLVDEEPLPEFIPYTSEFLAATEELKRHTENS
jgi:hypothetical protein